LNRLGWQSQPGTLAEGGAQAFNFYSVVVEGDVVTRGVEWKLKDQVESIITEKD
jgi:hypothetical protein